MQSIIAIMTPDVEVQWELTVARFGEWIKTDVFRFRWWLMLGLFIVTAYVWWKQVDKLRLTEIILYATIITIIILVLDELGEELTLWYYTTDLIPIFPPISAIDLSCMPIAYAIVYQYFRTWKSFIITSFFMSAIFCFVFEPIFVWSGVYQMITWKSYYGFPIYIFMAIIGKAIVSKIYSIASKV